MDAAAWIRSRLVGFTCAACGGPYRRDRIRVLAQREELFFVALDCAACATESVAIISLEPAGPGERPTLVGGEALGDERLTTDAAGAVRAGDILAMHEFLRDFEGDFHGLFGDRRRRPSGSAGA